MPGISGVLVEVDMIVICKRPSDGIRICREWREIDYVQVANSWSWFHVSRVAGLVLGLYCFIFSENTKIDNNAIIQHFRSTRRRQGNVTVFVSANDKVLGKITKLVKNAKLLVCQCFHRIVE